MRTSIPKLSVQSLPKDIARKTMSKNGRNPAPNSFKLPLPTSTTKVGEGLRTSDGHPIIRQSITSHPSIGTTMLDTMEAFPIRPPTLSQSQRKLRPSDFKKFVEKFEG